MSAAITVTGGTGGTSAIPALTYDDTYNSSLGTQIAAAIQASISTINVATISTGVAPAASTTGTNVLVVAASSSSSSPGSSGSITIPAGAGYQYIFDASTGGFLNLTANASGTYVLGNETIYFDPPTNTTQTILAGSGNDTFSEAGTYTISAGSGSDSYNLSGSGVVSLGSGVNSVLVSSGTDTIFASPMNATGNLIVGTGGGFVFHGGNTASVVVDTVYGGAGTVTGGFNAMVWGGSNEAVDFVNTNRDLPSFLAAGAGNETLVAAQSAGSVQLWANQTDASTHDLLIGSASAPSAFVGGAGTDSLIGGGGPDVFYIVANTAANSTAKDVIFNANSNDAIDLAGLDTLYGGAAGSGAAGKAVAAAFGSGASSITLKDGTTVTFANTNGSNGIHFTSS